MVITRTPFRISFFGGGTDYPAWYAKNRGVVLSASIDKYCYLNVRPLPPFFDYNYRVRYARNENTKTHDEIEHPSVRECLKFLNVKEGLEIQHTADLPAMSGLGSSSAFTVGLLHALYTLRGEDVSKMKLAKDAIHVEQERIKEHVGSQDQIAAAFGGLNKIEFRGNHDISITPLALPPERLTEIENHLMLFFTGFSRKASDIAAHWIKRTPQNAADLKKIAAMADRGAEILESGGNLKEFGALMGEAWKLKRGLAPVIATEHIDTVYARGMKAGALGGKLLGAGGGGFMLFFVEPEKREALRQALGELLHVPFRFERFGSHVIFSRHADAIVAGPVDAVILAGGLGTRLRNVVSDCPKPMAKVGGKPFLEYLVRKLMREGVRRIVLSVGYMADVIKDHFKDGAAFGVPISYVEEKEPLGTGGAICRAAREAEMGDEILVLNGDSYFDVDLHAFRRAHHALGGAGTLALRKHMSPTRSGVVELDGNSRIAKFHEKKAVEGEALINGGVYLLSHRALSRFPKKEVFSVEEEGFPAAISAGLFGFISDGYFIDIGTEEDYKQAQRDFPIVS